MHSSESSEAPQVSYQTPLEHSEVVDLGGKLFRKKVLPYRSISYKGGKLSIDRQTAERIVQSFKRGAVELVPLVLGGHSDDPGKTGGRVESLSAESDGLYATIQTNQAGEEAIRRNFNALPVSVRYLSDYRRESDGARFGPTLAHVASTFSPRMAGMGGWVEASSAPTGHIDLSESSWPASFVDPSGPPEGSSAPGKKTTNPKLQDDSWMRPGVADLSEATEADRSFIRRAEAYAFARGMSWNEATRHVTR